MARTLIVVGATALLAAVAVFFTYHFVAFTGQLMQTILV
jgi:hypothetical protein